MARKKQQVDMSVLRRFLATMDFIFARSDSSPKVTTKTQRVVALNTELDRLLFEAPSKGYSKALEETVASWEHNRLAVNLFRTWLESGDDAIDRRAPANIEAVRLLRLLVNTWDAIEQTRTRIPVRVATTPLLAFRSWPSVVRQIADDEAAGEKRHEKEASRDAAEQPANASSAGVADSIQFLSDMEPDRLNADLSKGAVWDIAMSYGEKTAIEKLKVPGKKETQPMRRCLLFPSGWLAGITVPPEATPDQRLRLLLDEKLLAVVNSFESIYGDQIARQLQDAGIDEARLVRKRTTVELHTFVRAGRGACLSTLNALGETDARLLDCHELDEDLHGASSIVLVQRKPDRFEDVASDRWARIDRVFTSASACLEDYERRYHRAVKFKNAMRPYTYCYLSASTQLRAGDPKLGLHFWRGTISPFQVHATMESGTVRDSLCVSSEYELFGADESERNEYSLPQTVAKPLHFHLFGRLSDTQPKQQTRSRWQLSLRGAASREAASDVFHGYIMFEADVPRHNDSADPIKLLPPDESSNEESQPLVGHWIGNIDVDTSPIVPDGGILILSPKELDEAALNQLAGLQGDMSLQLSPSWRKDLIPLVGKVTGAGVRQQPRAES